MNNMKKIVLWISFLFLFCASAYGWVLSGNVAGTPPSGGAPGAWAVEDEGGAYSAGADTTIASSAFVATSGHNILVVVISYNISAHRTVSSIADTATNSYSYVDRVYDLVGAGTDAEFWIATNVTGNASNVVTATYSGSTSNRGIIAVDLSGFSTSGFHDTGYAPAGNSSTGSPITSASDSTTDDYEVVFGLFWSYSPSSTFGTSGSSTLISQYGSAIGLSYREADSAGAYTIAATSDPSYKTIIHFAKAFVRQ